MASTAVASSSSSISGCTSLTEAPSVKAPLIGSYEEVTCRIPEGDRESIENKMAGLTHLEENLEKIQGQLAAGDYNSLDKDAFFYALAGVKEGKVDPKVLFRISDIETLRLQGVEFTVFDPLEKYQDPDKLRAFLYKATGKHLHGPMLERFIEALKALPKEDRLIMAFDPAHSKLKSDELKANMALGTLPTITQVLETTQKMNVFGRIKDPEKGNQYIRLSASLELFQLVLQERFGETAVTPNPVLGISTVEQIEQNGLTHTRDNCRFYLIPDDKGVNQLVTYDEADHYACEEDDFPRHDEYHTWVCSAMPPEDRLLSASMAQKLKKYTSEQERSPEDLKAMGDLYEDLIDMDYPSYYKLERTARVKGGEDRQLAEAEIKKREEYPKLAFAKHLFDHFFLAHANMQIGRLLSSPEATEEEKSTAKKVLSLTCENPFLSKSALEDTFSFVFAHFPKTPEYQSAIEVHVDTTRNSLTTALSQFNRILKVGLLRTPEARSEIKKGIQSIEEISASLEVVASTSTIK